MSNSYLTWMSDNWSTISALPLNCFCMPGSHDAGMSSLSNSTTWSFASNTQTQSQTILQQLYAGSRYFDIRPLYQKATWFTGHFSQVSFLGYEGSCGESLAQVFSDVNIFLNTAAQQKSAARSKELVILNFSHYYDRDNNRSLTGAQMDEIISNVKNALGSNMVTWDNPTVCLGSQTLEDILDRGNVLCVFDDLYNRTSPSTGIFSLGQSIRRSGTPAGLAMDTQNRLLAVLAPDVANVDGYGLAAQISADQGVSWSEAGQLDGVKVQPGTGPSLSITPDSGTVVIYTEFKTSALMITTTETAGTTWTPPVPIPNAYSRLSPTSAGPYGQSAGKLYVVYVANDGNNTLMLIMQDAYDHTLWSTPVSLGISVKSGTAPKLIFSLGTLKLLLMYVENSDGCPIKVMQATLDYPSGNPIWEAPIATGASSNCTPSVAASYGGIYNAMFIASDGTKKVYCMQGNKDGTEWTTPVALGMQADMAPAVLYSGYDDVALIVKTGAIVPTSVSPYYPTYYCGTAPVTLWKKPYYSDQWNLTPMSGNYKIFDEYSNSFNADTVSSRQSEYFDNFTNANGWSFCLSWTRTLTGRAQNAGLTSDSIKSAASAFNPCLDDFVKSLLSDFRISEDRVPNVLYLDYYGDPGISMRPAPETAMDLNAYMRQYF